jgi:hypothetical protein
MIASYIDPDLHYFLSDEFKHAMELRGHDEPLTFTYEQTDRLDDAPFPYGDLLLVTISGYYFSYDLDRDDFDFDMQHVGSMIANIRRSVLQPILYEKGWREVDEDDDEFWIEQDIAFYLDRIYQKQNKYLVVRFNFSVRCQSRW